MDNLIRFPQERRTACVEDYRETPAIIIVLPIVRIERDEPDPPGAGSRRRRRR